jgi:hypothetical protein
VRGLKWINGRGACTRCVNWRPAKLISTSHMVCLPVYDKQHRSDNTRVQRMYSPSHIDPGK